MVEVSSSSGSSSSSSSDEEPARKSKEANVSSGSDSKTRPLSKSIKPPKEGQHISKVSSESKINTSVNANVLAAMAKGTSKDFMSKMNAAMQRNFLPKSTPPEKLKTIGFDNNPTNSDNIKSPSKNKTHISTISRKSTDSSYSSSEGETKIVNVKTSQVKNVNNTKKNSSSSSSSDSDSNKESEVKKKKALLLLKKIQLKSKSSSEDSDSSDSEKSTTVAKQVSFTKSPTVFEFKKEAPHVSKSNNAAATRRGSSNSSESENDDNMTSILTQRETPTKKNDSDTSSSLPSSQSGSSSNSDEDTPKKVKKSSSFSSKQKSSDTEKNSGVREDALFSQFLNEHADYKEIRIKSSFDPTKLTKDDEIFICKVPKQIPPELLRNKEISLDKLNSINFGPDKYSIKTEQFKNKKQSLCLINRHKSTAFVNIILVGHIKVVKAPEKVEIDKQINLDKVKSEKTMVLPELKQRHPLFGSDLTKVILNKSVQNKLDLMIEDLNKKINKSKKKKPKLDNQPEKDSVEIIKDDVYKMLQFLHEASVCIDTNKVEEHKKSKKKSTKPVIKQQELVAEKTVKRKSMNDESFAEPPIKMAKVEESRNPSLKKKKKSKLKLNLPSQDIENIKSGNSDKPEKNDEKPKKNKHIEFANSTFHRTSLSADPKLFRTNESIIQPEQSKTLKHLEKIIKKVAKNKIGQDKSTTKTEVTPTEQIEPTMKKKKKKSKDKSKESLPS